MTYQVAIAAEDWEALTAERDALLETTDALRTEIERCRADLKAERKLTADVDKLTGENERLQAELAAYRGMGHTLQLQRDLDTLREENARLQAELNSLKLTFAHSSAERQAMLHHQLTELRDAAEAHIRVCSTCTGRTWLEVTLAKVTDA